MKTLTLHEPGKFVWHDSPPPKKPGPEDAVVRVHRVGICGTDMHAFTGKQPFFTYPRILGHELGVEIVEIGPNDKGLKPGDKCSVEPYVNCRQCIACRRGKPNCCARMQVIGVHTDGGMRESFSLPWRKLHVANALAYEQIALVETLAIGAHAVARAGVESDDNVLVLGAGPIGLSVIEFARAAGRVIVADINASRLAFCREKMEVADLVDLGAAGGTEAVERIKALTNGDMPTVVIDATGNAASMNGALRFLAPGGRLVYVGLFQGEFALSDPEFHRRETTLLGSRNALPADFERIIKMIENRQIDTAPWITHRCRFADVAREFPTWLTPESRVLKAMIEI